MVFYEARRDYGIEHFSRAGWDLPCPKASIFTRAATPRQFITRGSLAFSKLLMEETSIAYESTQFELIFQKGSGGPLHGTA
jgi:aspartate/methionine/tyrosine aminotransferase